MAFISTVDERYAGGVVSYSAGALDASNLLNFDAVIAESSYLNSKIAYGASVDDHLTADIDIYSLGVLDTGFYTIDVDDWTWDWGNYDSSSIASFEVLDVNGYSIGIQYSSYLNINLTITSSQTYYVKVTGPSYGEAQYSIEYTKTGELINYPATYALYVDGSAVVGETLSIAGTYFDSNGVPSADNLTSLVYWYRIKDGVDTRITGEAGSDYIVTSDDIGYYIGYLYGFIDSHGFSEATTSVISTAGLVQSNINSAPTVSSEIADASANKYILYSYDTSVNFSDADAGDTPTYSAVVDNGDGATSNLPSWLSIDSATGVISGKPANDAVGSLDIKVSAKDQDDASVSDTYTLTINDTTYKPVVIIIDNFSYRALEFNDTTLYNYDVNQSDIWQVSTTGEDVDVAHGDWSLYAFSEQLDSGVETILIDVDSVDGLYLSEQMDSVFNNIEEVIVDWLVENNTDTIIYIPSVLSASFSGGSVPNSALQTLINSNAVIVQSVANVSEGTGISTAWGDSYSDIINVAAYNVDLNGDSLHGNPKNSDVIDIYANGYITHLDWGWNFGTSFSTPRVAAEIANVLSEAFDELNTIGMSKDDIESLGDFDYSNYVESILNLIASDIYLEVDNNWYSEAIPVLSYDVTTSALPIMVPKDYDEASVHSITDAAYSLSPEVTNKSPAVSSQIDDMMTDEDVVYSYDASSHFSDTDVGDTLTYSAVVIEDGAEFSLPEWLIIDSSTGVISGTPTNNDAGLLNIIITATDRFDKSISNPFSLTINNVIDYDEFQVNTTNFHNQRRPDVTILDDDTYVVVWESKYQDGDSYGIYAQHFDVLGNKLGAEIQINTETEGEQSQPSISSLSDGGYVITWRSGVFNDDGWILDKGQDGSSPGIIAQRFDSNDNPIGSEVIINTYTNDGQHTPRVEGLSDDGYVIVWTSNNQDSDDSGIYAQQYDASSNKVNQEFLVNDTTIGYQYWPDITALDSGGYVVTWKSEEGETSKSDIYAKVFNSSGVTQTSEFKVNTYTENYQKEPSIATLANGDFIISWHSYMQTGSSDSYYDIYAQRFSESGIKINDEFMVNTHTQRHQTESSISALSDGGYVITWQSYRQDGDGYGIYAQRYNADSTKNGVETQINTFTSGVQDSPAVASLADKTVVVWVSDKQDNSGYGVYAQQYDAGGDELGGANNVYDSIADVIAIEDVAFELDISTNFDTQLSGEALTFDAKLVNSDDLPTWLSVNPNTGIISGTPDNDDTGLLYISAIATDNTTSKQYYDSFYLTVDNVNDAPTLTGDFDSNIVVGATSVGGSVVGNDVDEYQDIYDATNWTDYDRDESINGADTYTRINTNSDTKVYTYLKNDDDTETKTWDYILANGDWYKQVKNYDADGDFISHYTQSNGVDYYSQGSYDLNDNLTLVYSGDVATSLGLLYYDISGTKTTSSNGIDTSYSGVALTSEGRQLISTMDGVDEESNANIIRYTQTGLGIDSLIKDGVQLSIEDQQGIYGFLELTQDSEWIYTLDNTDPDTVAITTGVSEVDSFLVTLFDGYTSTTQTIDINIINANIITSVVSNDNLQGTAGIDHITTLGGSNTISALSGNDIINLSADSTWSSGYAALNVSNDASVGTDQKIILTELNRFSDVIDGGADVDTLNLTTGNDAFFIDDVYSDAHTSLDNSLVSTTQGINSTARIVNLEVINAGIGDDIVDLTSANFILANAIEINGEDGNDILWGSNGNDTINGGEGDDTIFGGTGNDTLTGGVGSDIFQFTATAGSDIITDFDVSEDSIELYYQAEDNHTNTNLSLASGVLTWDVDSTSNDVFIDLSTTTTSGNLNDLDALITFVEIV